MKITAINKLTLLAAMLIITLLNTHVVVAAATDSSGYWTCPMHPQIHKSEPGACPICGMDLVESIISSEPTHKEFAHEMSKIRVNVTQGIQQKIYCYPKNKCAFSILE